MKFITILVLVMGLMIESNTWALTTDSVQTNRYSIETLMPTLEQQQLLLVVINEVFPASVENVGDAIGYLLKPNGYQLAVSEYADDVHYMLLTQPLPAIHRQLGPMRLQTALDILGGDSFQVVVNPVKRTVSYRLNADYHDSVRPKEAEHARQLWEAHINRQLPGQPVKNCDNNNETLVYGPVKPGETLLGITRKLQLADVSTEQVLIALLDHNPHAFPTRNINQLLEQTLLQVPRQSQIAEVSPTVATYRVHRHYQQWIASLNTVQGD